MDWESILMVEGTPTGDGRLFEYGATSWRDLPLTLLYMPATDDGHDGSFPVGTILQIERRDTGEGTAEIIGRGTFAESDDPQVASAVQLIRDGVVRGVSVDVGLDRFEVLLMDEDAERVVDENGDELPTDEDGFLDPGDADQVWLEVENIVSIRVMEATIMAATVVPTPAFAEAMIEPVGAAVVASAIPDTPPREWFDDPHLEGPTPLTVTPEGRIYGHLAAWGQCHIGMPGCFTPPRSPSGYAMFRLGERETAEGPVAVGQITLHANHASLNDTARRAREHYEHTGAAVADVAAGEDPYGIWIAGALRPDLEPDDLIALRAAKLSGDWRGGGGQELDLVAALAVNVPGFPIPRGAVASGEDSDELVSLVAAGALRVGTRTARVAGRFTRVRRAATAAAARPTSAQGPDRGEDGAVAVLAARIHGVDLDALEARASAPAIAELAERV